MWAALEAPLIVFLVVVVPVWLVLHYRSKRSASAPAAAPASADGELAELWQTARRMEERIRTLERILDADTPNWRGRT